MHKILTLFLIIFLIVCNILNANISTTVKTYSDWANGQSVNGEINFRQGHFNILSELSVQGDDFDTPTLKSHWTSQNCNLAFVGGEKLRLNFFVTGNGRFGTVTPLIPTKPKMSFETILDNQCSSCNLGGLFLDTGVNILTIAMPYSTEIRIFIGASNVQFSSSFFSVAISSGKTYLKISKEENVYSVHYKKNSSDNWTTVYSVVLSSTASLSVGLGLSNVMTGYSSVAEYEYFKITPYFPQATWTSSPKYLSGTPTTQGIISWLEDSPAGTRTDIQTSTSHDGMNWSPWSLSYGDSFGSVITSPARQFIRVAATLSSDNSRLVTPILRQIDISYPNATPLAPLVTVPTHPQNKWSSSQNLNLQWSMPAGNPAPESSYTYWVYANNALTETATLAVSQASVGMTHSRPIVLNTEGDYRIDLQVKADNFSGGLTTTVVSYPFNFDRTSPGSTILTSPTHPELLFANNNSPVFNLSATDAMSGVSGYAVSLDKLNYGDPGAAINVWGNEHRYLDVENGTYYFHARAVDAAGNTGPVSHYGIRVDFSGALISDAYVKVLPNPVHNDVAKIEYQLAANASEVTLEFMGGTGETIHRATGPTSIGKNYYSWNVSGVANGVYFYRIKAKSSEDGKGYVVTKKLAIIR